jgi:hypothetical protein
MNSFHPEFLGSSRPIPPPFDITAASNEIKQIDTELKRIHTISISLKKRKMDIEQKIQKYLTENNHKGVMINDVTIVQQEKTKIKPLTKKEKEFKVKDLLKHHGISDSLFNEINNVTKGGTVTTQNKLIINYDNKK